MQCITDYRYRAFRNLERRIEGICHRPPGVEHLCDRMSGEIHAGELGESKRRKQTQPHQGGSPVACREHFVELPLDRSMGQ